jgi:hypothetical protein
MDTGADRVKAAFARLVATDAGASEVAAITAAMWTAVQEALSPIIGQQGVSALYRRSLHLTQAKNPKFPELDESVRPSSFNDLRQALGALTAPDAAAAASTALFATFYNLLSGLIGSSLLERLLGTPLDKPFIEEPVQDPSP